MYIVYSVYIHVQCTQYSVYKSSMRSNLIREIYIGTWHIGMTLENVPGKFRWKFLYGVTLNNCCVVDWTMLKVRTLLKVVAITIIIGQYMMTTADTAFSIFGQDGLGQKKQLAKQNCSLNFQALALLKQYSWQKSKLSD